MKADLDKKRSDHPDLLKDDPILDALTELFDGKVGEPYKGEALKKKLAEAKQRAEAKIPPGFLDTTGRKKKEGDKKYGDILVWFQLLDFAKKESRPLVLITDETGEDWWQKDHGMTIGPRPELLQEMHQEANGKWFYMYATDQFLEYSKDLLQLAVNPEVIREAKGLKEEDEERAAAGEAIREAYEAAREADMGTTLGPTMAGLAGLTPRVPDLTGFLPTVPDLSSAIPRMPDLSKLIPKIPDLSKLMPRVPDLSKALEPLMAQHRQVQQAMKALAPILEQQRQVSQAMKAFAPIFEEQRRVSQVFTALGPLFEAAALTEGKKDDLVEGTDKTGEPPREDTSGTGEVQREAPPKEERGD